MGTSFFLDVQHHFHLQAQTLKRSQDQGACPQVGMCTARLASARTDAVTPNTNLLRCKVQVCDVQPQVKKSTAHLPAHGKPAAACACLWQRQ